MFSAILILLLNVSGYCSIRYVKAGNPTPVAPYTTWATASDSIQKVLDICLSGDTIMIGSGVYTECVRSERRNIILTFIGTDVDSCIFDLSSYPPEGQEYMSIYVRHSIQVENLKFTTTIQINDHYGIFIGNGIDTKTIIIKHCDFSNLNDCIVAFTISGEISNNYFFRIVKAIQVNDAPSAGEYIKIKNNTIVKSRSWGIDCLFGNIYNNWIFLDYGDGIVGNNLFSSNLKIYNNFVTRYNNNPDWNGINATRNKIINNVVIGMANGISPESGTEVKNNIVANCSNTAIDFYNSSSAQGNDINYNLFYQNKKISSNLSWFNPDTTIYYTSDPMFENPDSNNFLLQMFSPLIDAGDPNIHDVDGSRSDVGLYGGPYGQSYQYKDLPPKKPKFTLAISPPSSLPEGEGNTDGVVDFNSFSLYRSRDPQFIPNDNNRIFSGIDTLFADSLTDPTGSYSYKLTAKDNQGNVSKLDSVTVVLTGISDDEEGPTPERIYLYQNYPNPFNPSTKIKFSLTEEAEVILRVYDVNGELVTLLQNGWLSAGEYEREFSPATIGTLKDLASGVYFYNLLVRNKNLVPLFVKTEKMMFLK
ncbi:hypothetical protein MASR2M39_14080 [Ignavibacteriales bacterium]